VAEARLEQPEEIMTRYLAPAITELRGQSKGIIAGQVFHQFASFCDNQLQNPDAVEDFSRVQRMRDRRKQELDHLQQQIQSTKSSTEKKRAMSDWKKLEKWYRLDDHEYQRLRKARESFMTQSLENYLLSLAASSKYDNDVLRFFSIWLEYADSSLANNSVSRHLDKVPSGKFARLMNQLSSRLQADSTFFQQLLGNLVLRIATDHPYHAMHHISAGAMSLGIKDESGKSRMQAAKQVASALQIDKKVKHIWHGVYTTNHMYHTLAILKDKDGQKKHFIAGYEVKLEAFTPSRAVLTKVKEYKVPPPTMTIALRTDMDYSKVPVIVTFRPKMRIANGLSAPKILTALCSDGNSFKQLVSSSTVNLVLQCL
jgi:ataxia telangiectasia mutated family protein